MKKQKGRGSLARYSKHNLKRYRRFGTFFAVMLLSGILATASLLMACSSGTDSGQTNEGSQDNGAGAAAITQSIIIGTMATEDILPLWVAEQEGIFAELGLEQVTIQTFQSAQELSTALVAGAIDMAMTDIMVSATLTAAGTPVELEWITLGTTASQGRFGIMTSPESGITSLKDLADVPIGVGSCTVPEYVMDKLMESAGISSEQIVGEEIKKVPVRYELMTSNQVAAAALPASLLALGEAQGMVCLADDTQGENLSQSIMIMNEELADSAEGKEALEGIAEAWNKAVERINSNPEAYRGLLVEKAQLPEIIKDSYPVSEYPLVEKPSAAMVDSVLEWMHEKGYLTNQLTYNETTGRFASRDA